MYWRPGCHFCARLRARLGRHAGKAHWVDIWADPAAAAALRALTGGDEVVPTVVVRGAAHLNPDPRWVRAQLR
ncbi:glutaredoxin domain-containing protein [Actinotalea ferrariae]|uniref:glutaredoxin domain-containing protein n=1 Tax=Actinotalea ferrariae TaxID=1386098 RepID=UPI0027E02CC6|nr:glutaredoxin domain-containing protein [Actinotalea ferrariae]